MKAARTRYPTGVAQCFAVHWAPASFAFPEPLLSAAAIFFQHHGAQIERIAGSKSIVKATTLNLAKSRERRSFEYYAGGKFGTETLLTLAWDVCVECSLDKGDFFCGTTKSGDPKYAELITSMIETMLRAKVPISIGYSFVRELKFGPSAFPDGIISTTEIDPEDADEIANWGEHRLDGSHLKQLRGVNDLQILSPDMSRRKIERTALRKWISAGSGRGTLDEISDGYFLWRAPSLGREAMRRKLRFAKLST